MKIKITLFILTIFLLSSVHSFSQKYATTDEGLRVQLNDNGTWVLLEKDTTNIITVNTKPFTKPVNNIAIKKSKENKTQLHYNPVKWKVAKDKNNEDAEFEFEHVDGVAYAMAITEKIEIPLESLKKIAYDNLVGSAPDTKIDKAEYRTVNGAKVLHLVMSGAVDGIKFVYYGYYYSNENGTTQLVCYTGRKFLDEYQKDFDDFLNGFIGSAKE